MRRFFSFILGALTGATPFIADLFCNPNPLVYAITTVVTGLITGILLGFSINTQKEKTRLWIIFFFALPTIGGLYAHYEWIGFLKDRELLFFIGLITIMAFAIPFAGICEIRQKAKNARRNGKRYRLIPGIF